jgi:hypothetical protein
MTTCQHQATSNRKGQFHTHLLHDLVLTTLRVTLDFVTSSRKVPQGGGEVLSIFTQGERMKAIRDIGSQDRVKEGVVAGQRWREEGAGYSDSADRVPIEERRGGPIECAV